MADKKYTRNQLVKKTQGELITIWTDDEGLDITDLDGAPKPTKATLIAALTEIDAPDDDELDDELDEELDDEEEGEPDVEDEEPEAELDDEEEDDLELPEEDEVEEDDIEEEVEEKPAPKKRSRAKKTDDGEGSGTLAAKQVATILGTEAKTLRQFFRSPASTVEAVGSGGRYEFAEADIDKIKSEFEAWKAGHGSRGNKRSEGGSSKKSRKTEAPVEVEEIEELEIEDLEDEELELEDED